MINLLKGSQGAHMEVCHSIWEMREQESCTRKQSLDLQWRVRTIKTCKL